MTVLEALGPAMRKLRKEKGMTILGLAGIADVEPSNISLWESSSGGRLPSLRSIDLFCQGIGIKVSELFVLAEQLSRVTTPVKEEEKQVK